MANNMVGQLKSAVDYFTDFKTVIFLSFSLLLLVTLLVFDIKIGLIVVIGAALLATILLKPKIVYFLLISLFSIEGFGAMPGVSAAKLLGVLFLIGLALRLTMTREAVPKDSLYKYYYLFFAGSIVSFAFAQDLSMSLRIYVTYVSLFFLYIFTRIFLRNMKDIDDAINFLILSALIVTAYMQLAGVTVRSGWLELSRVSGGIGDANEFASYILVLIPLIFYLAMKGSGFLKILYWFCLVIFMGLLALTGSRGGFLGFAGVSMIFIRYYSVGKLRQMLIFIVCIMTLSLFFIPDSFWERVSTITNPEAEVGSSIETRMTNYKAALKMFADYPIAGVGLYNFQIRNKDYGVSKRLVVHNTYLEILTGGGLLSFIPFCMLLVQCWQNLRIKKAYKGPMRDMFICLKASFISILITSFFISADHKKILWFLLALISSAYYIASMKKEISLQTD